MQSTDNNDKKISIWMALIPIIFLVVSLSVTLVKFEGEAHIPLLLSTAVAAIVALKLGYKWEFLEKSMIQSISVAMQAILILMVIGVIIGTWIAGGIVPTMIYYGLELLSPTFFLVTTCILCNWKFLDNCWNSRHSSIGYRPGIGNSSGDDCRCNYFWSLFRR